MPLNLSRRSLVAGLAVAPAAPLIAAPAVAAPLDLWGAYRLRLAARLADAGGGGGVFDERIPRDLLVQNNQFRFSQGLKALAWDEDLAVAARAHAADMAHRNFFDHRTSELFDVGGRVGLLARTLLGSVGENLAYRYNTVVRASADGFFRQWVDSPGHRENMLKASYTHVGYAVTRHGDHGRAVGVFAGIDARLSAPLPWLVTDRTHLERALAASHPAIDRYGISEPAVTQPYDIASFGRHVGPLPPEVSQLRPLLPNGEGRFDVLWGPIFVVRQEAPPSAPPDPAQSI